VNEILLVEDNPDDVELTRRAFRQSNFSNEIVVVRDGIEALQYLSDAGSSKGGAAAPLPQLVLLDLKLPRMDGLELLERLRGNPKTKLLPVVILTSSTEPRDLVGGYSLGANSYIRKPVDFEEFVETVRQLGRYWLMLNEPPPAL
jgi:two-component system response regulator